jgi:hypothetical protein
MSAHAVLAVYRVNVAKCLDCGESSISASGGSKDVGSSGSVIGSGYYLKAAECFPTLTLQVGAACEEDWQLLWPWLMPRWQLL